MAAYYADMWDGKEAGPSAHCQSTRESIRINPITKKSERSLQIISNDFYRFFHKFSSLSSFDVRSASQPAEGRALSHSCRKGEWQWTVQATTEDLKDDALEESRPRSVTLMRDLANILHPQNLTQPIHGSKRSAMYIEYILEIQNERHI